MLKDRQRNKFIDSLLVKYFSKKGNLTYSLDGILSKEKVIIHTHLGLGDNIICNGLVNKLSHYFEEIHLPVKNKYSEMIRFLYKNNSKIKFFEVSYSNSTYDVLMHSYKQSLPLLRIGFESQNNDNFNVGFYEQINFDYSDSYVHFDLPLDPDRSSKLYDHLINYYEINDQKYNLVHDESHDNKFDLKNTENFKSIYVSKDSDLFNNMLLYNKVIENAREIHCINSSFFHLVDRISTNAKLYYHDVRFTNFQLPHNWERIHYH